MIFKGDNSIDTFFKGPRESKVVPDFAHVEVPIEPMAMKTLKEPSGTLKGAKRVVFKEDGTFEALFSR